MGNWTIRRAEHHDADALSTCIDAAYAEYAARIADLPPVSADCAEEIARFQVWVAEIANDIVGGMMFSGVFTLILLPCLLRLGYEKSADSVVPFNVVNERLSHAS